MSTDYFYDTNLVRAEFAIKEDFVFPKIAKKDNFLFFYYSTEILKSQFIEYVHDQLNFKIDTVFLFYKAVNSNPRLAHYDLYDKNTIATNALNWCIDEPNGEMMWHDHINTVNDIQIGKNNKGIDYPYILIDVSDKKPVARKVIGKEPVLVRTDILHSVEIENKPRWTVSCRSNLIVTTPWKNLPTMLNI
jgi:hypothetical protein